MVYYFDLKYLPKFKSSVNDDLSVGKYDIPYFPYSR
jgi:hypothetical protein